MPPVTKYDPVGHNKTYRISRDKMYFALAHFQTGSPTNNAQTFANLTLLTFPQMALQ